MRLVKILSILIIFLTIISCSGDKSSNSKTSKYKGGEIVDGYTLPPMPPKGTNDATLLGIDTNNNSIRDDVEIYIYNRFEGYTNSKVEREIAKQWARTAQQLIQSPETAYEDKKYELSHRAIDCLWYYYYTYFGNITFGDTASYNRIVKYLDEHDIFNAEFKDVIFNTRERLDAYFRYNKSLSGNVFDDRPHTKDNCDFDPDPLIEGTLK